VKRGCDRVKGGNGRKGGTVKRFDGRSGREKVGEEMGKGKSRGERRVKGMGVEVGRWDGGIGEGNGG